MSKDFRIEAWCKDIQDYLEKMKDVDIGYPKGSDYLQLANDLSHVELKKYQNMIPNDLLAFYQVCNSLQLSSIYNGYFIDSPARIIENKKNLSTPMKILGGKFESDVLMFGSNGGGGKFVIMLDNRKILYLPTYGAVVNNIFDGNLNKVYPVANNLFEFLEKLRLDIEAVITKKKNWEYIVSL